MNAVLLWAGLLGVVGSLLFSTLSSAMRMMSRVPLEEQLARFHREDALDAILRLRYELALSASALRLLANVTVIVAAVYYFQGYLGPGTAVWITVALAVATSTPVLLVFSIAIPQAWARYAGEFMIAATWPLLRTAHAVTYPLVAALKVFDWLIRRLSGANLEDEAPAEQAQQEIMAAVDEGAAEGMVDAEQKKMIEGVISFRDLQVGQIMTPRTEIVAVEVAATLAEVRERILKDGVSRLPVFEGTLDNIVGILYAKDLLNLIGGEHPFELRKLMRPPLFVPQSKPLRDLLRELRLQQVHVAIVLDEYGGTSGLVTTEDIVEEIVGEIADEYEHPEPAELKFLDPRTVEVDARINLSELNRTLELQPPLPEDQDYHTLGGFVMATLGAIPVKGERLTHDGLAITVLESEPRRVKRLRLELPERTPSEPSAEI